MLSSEETPLKVSINTPSVTKQAKQSTAVQVISPVSPIEPSTDVLAIVPISPTNKPMNKSVDVRVIPPVRLAIEVPSKDVKKEEIKMSMVIPPDYKGVVVEDNDDRGGRRGDCGGISTKDSIAAALNTTLNALSENTIQTVGLLKDPSTDMSVMGGQLGVAISAVGSNGIQATTDSRAILSGQLSDKTATVLASVGDKSEHLSDKVCEGFREVTGRMSDSRVEVLTAITGNAAATQNVLRDGFAANAMASQREAAAIQASICAAAAASALASANTTAAILAKQNDSDAKLAACCCAMEAEMARQACAARELALAVESRSISAALVTANARIQALETQATVASAIQAALGGRCGSGCGGHGGHGGPGNS